MIELSPGDCQVRLNSEEPAHCDLPPAATLVDRQAPRDQPDRQTWSHAPDKGREQCKPSQYGRPADQRSQLVQEALDPPAFRVRQQAVT